MRTKRLTTIATTSTLLALTAAADVNADGVVDVTDLLQVLDAWRPCTACGQDVNGDGQVDVLDLLAVLAAW